MKYLIDLSARQSQKIQKYLDEGHYQSIPQFIVTAIENQFNLEDNGLPTDVASEMESVKLKNDSPGIISQSVSVLDSYKIAKINPSYTKLQQPEFNQTVLSSQGLKENQTWIWGQINKIFPIKLGLRILHKSLANKQTIELNEFLDLAAREASEVSNTIRIYENKNNKTRGEKISAGLPLKNDEKSQSRYKFQFLAYQRKDGLLDGGMALLRFCNIPIEKKNSKLFIGITDAGDKFSLLPNPVLDDGDLDNSLSKAEVEFYLNHIKENVKSEYLAIKWMLDKISNGNDEREKLNEVLRKEYEKIWDASDAVINTQRAGITARMFELGLIEKEKDGIYVTYSISELGKKYLSSN